MGLSPAHNSTHTLPARAFSAAGARLAGVKFPHQQSKARPPGGLRGQVTDFSRASRRRLLNTLASINRDRCKRLPLFVTLTYPDAFPEDPRRWKLDLKAWRERLTRKLGPTAVLWRLELQVRKSGANVGKVAPHYHLLIFTAKKPQDLYSWVSTSWYEVVKSGDTRHELAGTRVEDISSWNGVMNYAAKYMAKAETLQIPAADGVPTFRTPGRFWGVWCRELLPILIQSFDLAVHHALRVKRVLRKFAQLRPGGEYQGLSVYLSDSTFLRLLGCDLEPLGP